MRLVSTELAVDLLLAILHENPVPEHHVCCNACVIKEC
jgi:hypothetical protein